VTSKQ